jgi:TPP-dependent pyruvate/acetoin dehydrogenase alpha subunit
VNTDADTWLNAYRDMKLIRRFEESVEQLVLEAKLPGFLHLYKGEEASAVGVCGALEEGDLVFSTHRADGHCLARGSEPAAILHELYGNAEGLCHGKSGSMHLVDLENGFFMANAIVGAALPIALGPALHSKLKNTRRVSVVFFGDGASNQGAFHEALNLAAVWRLPVLFVCENNGYANSTPREFHQLVDSVSDRAAAYGMVGVTVDGQDVRAVRAATREAIDRARRGDGPTLLETLTYRYLGHYVGDPLGYRSDEEVDQAKKRDPIDLLATYLRDECGVESSRLEEIDAAVEMHIADALEAAAAGTPPARETAFTNVYVSYE